MNDKTQPPAPKPAATILLLRDGKPNLEVFMVVRHHQIDFASGELVFPGGKADPQDFAEALIPFLSGHSDDSDQRAAQVSAIREAFEECGILLARELGSQEIISGERLATLQTFREPMNKGELSLLDFLQQQQLQLACDELTHFAHWITPPMMPKRFDTHFYLATAPADHIVVCSGELLNPLETYTLDQLDRWAKAEASDETVMIRTPEEINDPKSRPLGREMITWRFRIKNCKNLYQ